MITKATQGTMKMKRVAMKQSEGLEEASEKMHMQSKKPVEKNAHAKQATLGGSLQYKQHSNSSVAIWAFL